MRCLEILLPHDIKLPITGAVQAEAQRIAGSGDGRPAKVDPFLSPPGGPRRSETTEGHIQTDIVMIDPVKVAKGRGMIRRRHQIQISRVMLDAIIIHPDPVSI